MAANSSNPFDRFSLPTAPVYDDGEQWGGAFSCMFCDDVATIADYDRNNKVLSWTCANEHLSKIEDYND